jgi:hypothetical protein
LLFHVPVKSDLWVRKSAFVVVSSFRYIRAKIHNVGIWVANHWNSSFPKKQALLLRRSTDNIRVIVRL